MSNRRSIRSLTFVSAMALLGAGATFLGGCSAQDSRLAAYRRNPTPELDTLARRHDDIMNELTIMADTNGRLLNEDLGRFLLLDRPSHLSPTSIPH